MGRATRIESTFQKERVAYFLLSNLYTVPEFKFWVLDLSSPEMLVDDSCFEAAASNDSGILGAPSVAPCTVVGADGQYLNPYHEFRFD